MHCLKCGKQTKSEHVFCPGCLTVMEAYPVKPDVHIQLPKDANRESPKKSGRKRRCVNDHAGCRRNKTSVSTSCNRSTSVMIINPQVKMNRTSKVRPKI